MVCRVYVDAEDAGALTASQLHVSKAARRLLIASGGRSNDRLGGRGDWIPSSSSTQRTTTYSGSLCIARASTLGEDGAGRVHQRIVSALGMGSFRNHARSTLCWQVDPQIHLSTSSRKASSRLLTHVTLTIRAGNAEGNIINFSQKKWAWNISRRNFQVLWLSCGHPPARTNLNGCFGRLTGLPNSKANSDSNWTSPHSDLPCILQGSHSAV